MYITFPLQVNWDFVLFDNGLIWLIQFTDRNGFPFRRYDTAAGSAKTGYGHLAFWMDSNLVNPYQVSKNTKPYASIKVVKNAS